MLLLNNRCKLASLSNSFCFSTNSLKRSAKHYTIYLAIFFFCSWYLRQSTFCPTHLLLFAHLQPGLHLLASSTLKYTNCTTAAIKMTSELYIVRKIEYDWLPTNHVTTTWFIKRLLQNNIMKERVNKTDFELYFFLAALVKITHRS